MNIVGETQMYSYTFQTAWTTVLSIFRIRGKNGQPDTLQGFTLNFSKCLLFDTPGNGWQKLHDILYPKI